MRTIIYVHVYNHKFILIFQPMNMFGYELSLCNRLDLEWAARFYGLFLALSGPYLFVRDHKLQKRHTKDTYHWAGTRTGPILFTEIS